MKGLAEHLRSKVRINSRVEGLASRYGYRPYMVSRYVEMFGDFSEVEELLRSFERGLRNVVRCNKLKLNDCRELGERLEALGFTLRTIEWSEGAYEVISEPGRPSIGSTHEHLLGLYYLYRGKASLIPPPTLTPSREDSVGDLAAAPGGKTVHMAQIMGNEGLIVALEPRRDRLSILRNNVERMGVKNAVLLKLDARRADTLFRGYFSKVLLDAPCTGEGIIMLDPGRKTRTSLDDLVRQHVKQVEMLRAALNTLKEGGRLLYTTCSIAPEENELVVSEVLESSGDVRTVRLNTPVMLSPPVTDYYGIHMNPQVRLCGRTYPHIHHMEGFFLCMLEKSGE